MPVATSKVPNRRDVHYASLQDVLADAERLSHGGFNTLGNWSAGQIFLHLARSMNDSIDGSDMRLPWYLKLLGPLLKKKLLGGPMAPGVMLPESVAKVTVPGPTTTEEGMAALRSAIARLESESKRAPSPFLGAMTKEEWNRLHLNHSALHMSFLVSHNQG
jgi:Protein of unknown function (DUF1569)